MAFIAVLIAAVILLPQLWVQWTLSRHAGNRPDLPGTGGELAEHLIERFGLDGVTLELSDHGDHYDPEAKAVRLSPNTMSGRSLSAVAIAAHEVSHAIQHAAGDRWLMRRQRLATIAQASDRIAGFFFAAAPVFGVLARTPAVFLGLLAVGIGLLSVRVIFNLITLPVELDASFSKALPILREGRYLGERDMPAAHSVLRAAAFTYVAGALISLINLARWIRLLR